jgi:hypothetical protein
MVRSGGKRKKLRQEQEAHPLQAPQR